MTFDSCVVLLTRKLRTVIRDLGLTSSRRFARRLHMALAEAARVDGAAAATPPAVAVFRQALATFPPKKDFSRNMERLRVLMSKLRAEDVGLDPIYKDASIWKDPQKAPCTYIEVFQNQDINMSIFILAPGYKMPLHDHPHMHGLLKVVSGAVRMRSFSEHQLTVVPPDVQLRDRSGGSKRRKFFAQTASNVICRENSETCILTPTAGNFHELEALELPAAFVDILAPPYDTCFDGVKRRRCHYYKIINEVATNVVELEEIDVPDTFFCDQAPYLGPLLS